MTFNPRTTPLKSWLGDELVSFYHIILALNLWEKNNARNYWENVLILSDSE
jgi:hypothetical protein